MATLESSTAGGQLNGEPYKTALDTGGGRTRPAARFSLDRRGQAYVLADFRAALGPLAVGGAEPSAIASCPRRRRSTGVRPAPA